MQTTFLHTNSNKTHLFGPIFTLICVLRVFLVLSVVLQCRQWKTRAVGCESWKCPLIRATLGKVSRHILHLYDTDLKMGWSTWDCFTWRFKQTCGCNSTWNFVNTVNVTRLQTNLWI